MAEKKDKEKASPDDSLAGDSREALSYETLPVRLVKYADLHQRALNMSGYIKTWTKNKPGLLRQYGGVIAALRECGHYLVFRDYYTVNQVRLHHASFCNTHLLCPLCGLRRGNNYVSAYMERLQINLDRDPDLVPYLVTLTLKNGPDLLERWNHMKAGHRNMTRMRREAERGLRPCIEMNKALGGVSSYEVKIGSGSNEWHVHNHAIWLCKEQPYETRLSEEWREITGDSYIVDIRKVQPKNDTDNAQIISLLEVFAYTLKASTMDLADNFKAYQELKGQRFINSFGLFRGVEVPESLTDEPLEDLPYTELIYQYIYGTGYNFVPEIKKVS